MLQEYFAKVRERSWKIYDKYYGGGGYKHHNERYRQEILRHLGTQTMLLDAGAGEMTFTREFAPKVRLAVGTDIGPMKTTAGGPVGVQSNLDHLPFQDASFDVVISMSVVEHLANPEASFRELSRVLKPKGVLIAQTPSKYDYVSLLAHWTPFWFHRWLLSRLLDRRAEDIFPTCFRANTRRQMRACLEAARLTPRNIIFFNQYPAYLMFWPLLFRLGILYERLTSRYDGLDQLRGWMFVIAEKGPVGQESKNPIA